LFQTPQIPSQFGTPLPKRRVIFQPQRELRSAKSPCLVDPWRLLQRSFLAQRRAKPLGSRPSTASRPVVTCEATEARRWSFEWCNLTTTKACCSGVIFQPQRELRSAKSPCLVDPWRLLQRSFLAQCRAKPLGSRPSTASRPVVTALQAWSAWPPGCAAAPGSAGNGLRSRRAHPAACPLAAGHPAPHPSGLHPLSSALLRFPRSPQPPHSQGHRRNRREYMSVPT